MRQPHMTDNQTAGSSNVLFQKNILWVGFMIKYGFIIGNLGFEFMHFIT